MLDATGYGNASREYVLALDRLGYDIKIEAYTWNFPFKGMEHGKRERLQSLIEKPYARDKKSVLINHSPPDNIAKQPFHYPYDVSLLNTVWETNRIPQRWLPIIQRFRAVGVPCTSNVTAFQKGGVQVPIFHVPHGAETDVFKPDHEKLPLKEAAGKFVFVSVFDFQHRKNPEAMFRAYWEEFRAAQDQVILVVKTYGGKHSEIKERIRRYKKRLGYGPETAPVYIIDKLMDQPSMAGLYVLGDAFVLPTRGEGVGLPFIEALASGIPVIATGWGGHMDFVHAGNGFLVDYKLESPVRSMKRKNTIAKQYADLFSEEGHLWAEVRLNHLQKQMRHAYENRELCRQKGQQGRSDMLQLTWDKAGLALQNMIRRVVDST